MSKGPSFLFQYEEQINQEAQDLFDRLGQNTGVTVLLVRRKQARIIFVSE
jgi:hypothetical protein